MGVSAKVKIGAVAAALALGGLSALVIVSRSSDEPEPSVGLAPTGKVSEKPHSRRSSTSGHRRKRNPDQAASQPGSPAADAEPSVVEAPQTQPAIVPAPDQTGVPESSSAAPDEDEAAPTPESEHEAVPEGESEGGEGRR